MTARWAVRAATETEPSRRRNGVGETEPLMVHQNKGRHTVSPLILRSAALPEGLE